MPVQFPDGTAANILFVDTEGFESTGKADVYDDRIFALSTLISQVLIYNLPEAIRESDLEKLSFAVELAKAFYITDDDDDNNDNNNNNNNNNNAPVQPGSMIWLIQRDFLQGDSPDKALITALRQVPNPFSDPGIDNLNRIRGGLSLIATNSTALGLPQPHIDRTRLCEMSDAELNPEYVQKRDTLRGVVNRAAVNGNGPKMVNGRQLDGPGLAVLVRQVVEALNERDIPTAGSLVEYFNKDLVRSCVDVYGKELGKLVLPMEETEFRAAASRAEGSVFDKFHKEKFGTAVGGLKVSLKQALSKELDTFMVKNINESSRKCEKAEEKCEAVLEHEASQRLPSKSRFKARFDDCSLNFHTLCIGPGLAHAVERLAKSWDREYYRFSKDYNERLYNGLVLASIALIVVFRFVVKVSLGETVGWIAFLFLQVYPKTFLGESSMYKQGWWEVLADAWETLIYKAIDLDRWGVPLGVGVVVMGVTKRWWWGWVSGELRRRRLKGGRNNKKKLGDSDRERDLNV